MKFTICQRNRLKMPHLNLFTFTIGELHYYRLFKISAKVCSVIIQLPVSYRHEPTLVSWPVSLQQALTERYFRTDYNIIYNKKIQKI